LTLTSGYSMIDSAKFLELSRQLEDHHAVFYTLWQLGKPVSDPSIPTACVNFDQEGECLEFAFNPEFWDRCTDDDKLFVICHESLHVILRHGVRCSATKDPHRSNIALDLVVNHMLVTKFGFDRAKITDWKNLIWVETVFPDQKVADDLSYEQYFQLLSDQQMDTLDNHDWNTDSEKWIERIEKRLGNEEKESLKNVVEKHSAGTEPVKFWCFADKTYVKPKKKWETVIKKWAKKYDRHDLRDVEQWVRVNRRYSCLQSDFILPTEMEEKDNSQSKIGVWFFQDTSASCYTHRNRFFTAAKSLPKDRFDVKLYCFDTQVFETTLESGKLYGFGGTAYHPIEQYIQNFVSTNNVAYPQAVFVITDGFGTSVIPKFPDRWFWFLSSTYTLCIPHGSKIFQLKDFE
jgi:predicted metal-dependent peptidase